jgi:hypothetical protein
MRGMDGHFIGYEPMVCADDAEAIEKATRLVDGHEVELWSGQRPFSAHSPPSKVDAVGNPIRRLSL